MALTQAEASYFTTTKLKAYKNKNLGEGTGFFYEYRR